MSGADELGFGPFRLSLRHRTLTTSGGPVTLSSRAFDVLAALVDSRQGPVGKDELIRRVWGDIVVEENNLHVQIAAIRRALGAEHRYILTIPARGYHFVGDVIELASAAAPAQRPAREALGNLPLQLTDLVGREAEIDAALALLEKARLVTLVGPGGVGKSKLALAIARRLEGRHPGGAWLLELGSLTDPALTASALAACLRIEEVQDLPLTQNLVAYLRPRELLLVVDGCEHVLAAVAELTSQLAHQCPHVRCLFTSQAPLGVEGEHVLRIAPFEVGEALDVATPEAALRQDAVRLFAERAGAGDGRFAVTEAMLPGIIEICRHLEGVPLAIELAAARVPLLGLEPVRQRIAGRLALLGDDRRDTPQRHRTLQATIEWSHGLLTESAREILRRLSIFAGGFTLEAAQQVAVGAGVAETDVVRGVSDLVQRSMLTTGPDLIQPRHRMLELMRAFALEALERAGERDAVARRHGSYFLSFAAAADARWETTGDVEWTAMFAPELANLRAALEWALGDGGELALGAQIAGASARFWFEAGHFSEGRKWLSRALERAPPNLDATTMIKLKRGLADLSLDAAAAVEAAAEALALAEKQDDAALIGVCLRALSAARYRLGDYEAAQELTRRALDSLSRQPASRTFGQCLGDLCILRGVAGDYAEARRCNAQAQTRLSALGDRRGAAICLQYAAEFEFADGNVDAAEALAGESVALFRSLGARYHLEIGLGNLAAYQLAAGETAVAAATAAEALVIADEIGDRTGVLVCLESLALAVAHLGAAETAARLHGHIEVAHRELGLTRQETERAIHDRLIAAVSAVVSDQRLSRLVLEGEVLDTRAAVTLALGAVGERASSPAGKLAASVDDWPRSSGRHAASAAERPIGGGAP
jgi:predicted ATPase/DNA-binding winged helix-turn-helix (wHTH) protein